MIASPAPHLTVLAVEINNRKAVAGKADANVHTAGAFNPTAQQAALKETA
jgi:hypothetical protein